MKREHRFAACDDGLFRSDARGDVIDLHEFIGPVMLDIPVSAVIHGLVALVRVRESRVVVIGLRECDSLPVSLFRRVDALLDYRACVVG